jgi:DNA replication protein DnaC
VTSWPTDPDDALAERVAEAELLWLRSCPPRFQSATWERCVVSADRPYPAEAISVAERWLSDPTCNLVIGGSVGVGKTTLACATVHRALTKGYKVGFRAMFASLVDTFTLIRENPQHLRTLKNVRYLLLDDLGAGRSQMTDWEGERLYELVNHRYNFCLPTVITTNVPLPTPEAGGIADEVGSQIWDRIRDGALAVEIGGTSRRGRTGR